MLLERPCWLLPQQWAKVVAFHWIPPWHWSMTNAIARKSFQCLWTKALGLKNTFHKMPDGWKDCQTFGCCATKFHGFLGFLNFLFAWKSTWTYILAFLVLRILPHLEILFQILVHFKTFCCNGLECMVEHYRCSALQDSMHPIVPKLGNWLH